MTAATADRQQTPRSGRVPDFFLCMDYETTVLEPYAPNAHILEYGAILVRAEAPTFPEVARANMILNPGGDRAKLWATMPLIVRDMHTASGLWEATSTENAWSITDADKAIRDWLVEKVGGMTARDGRLPQIAVCGSGVAAFDVPWMRAHMPQLTSVVHYRPMDTSPIHTLLEVIGRHDLVERFASEPTHRALPDAQRGLDELRLFAELFGRLPAAVDV